MSAYVYPNYISQIPARYNVGFECWFCSQALSEQIFQALDSALRQKFIKEGRIS